MEFEGVRSAESLPELQRAVANRDAVHSTVSSRIHTQKMLTSIKRAQEQYEETGDIQTAVQYIPSGPVQKRTAQLLRKDVAATMSVDNTARTTYDVLAEQEDAWQGIRSAIMEDGDTVDPGIHRLSTENNEWVYGEPGNTFWANGEDWLQAGESDINPRNERKIYYTATDAEHVARMTSIVQEELTVPYTLKVDVDTPTTLDGVVTDETGDTAEQTVSRHTLVVYLEEDNLSHALYDLAVERDDAGLPLSDTYKDAFDEDFQMDNWNAVYRRKNGFPIKYVI